jgi:uroporphyrinogen-III decarboxylase
MSTYTNRERVLAALNGEELDHVPGWIHSFCNLATVKRLTPAELWDDAYDRFITASEQPFAPLESATLDRMIEFNRFLDRPMMGVGRGGLCFGHGGPGEFVGYVVEETPEYRVIEFETGARAKLQFAPHFYNPYQMPVTTIQDLEALQLPDPDEPQRWQGVAADVAYLKSRGEYTVGYLNGFFSGAHYYFSNYEDFLLALLVDPELAKRIVGKLGDWNLKAAKQLCLAGVDSILIADDLGSNKNLLISPELYNQFFFDWHRRVCDLAHTYDVHVHLHSHGNIMKILDRLVEAGIDMLNPLDQSEGMDLSTIKGQYGDRLTLVGGLDRHIYYLNDQDMEHCMAQAVKIGRPNGRFILCDPSGIPDDIPTETFHRYLQIGRRVRGQI